MNGLVLKHVVQSLLHVGERGGKLLDKSGAFGGTLWWFFGQTAEPKTPQTKKAPAATVPESDKKFANFRGVP